MTDLSGLTSIKTAVPTEAGTGTTIINNANHKGSSSKNNETSYCHKKAKSILPVQSAIRTILEFNEGESNFKIAKNNLTALYRLLRN
jgi:hypothetical protein